MKRAPPPSVPSLLPSPPSPSPISPPPGPPEAAAKSKRVLWCRWEEAPLAQYVCTCRPTDSPTAAQRGAVVPRTAALCTYYRGGRRWAVLVGCPLFLLLWFGCSTVGLAEGSLSRGTQPEEEEEEEGGRACKGKKIETACN